MRADQERPLASRSMVISTPQKVKLALLVVKVTCNNDKTAKSTLKALAFDINIVSDISMHTDYSVIR